MFMCVCARVRACACVCPSVCVWGGWGKQSSRENSDSSHNNSDHPCSMGGGANIVPARTLIIQSTLLFAFVPQLHILKMTRQEKICCH